MKYMKLLPVLLVAVLLVSMLAAGPSPSAEAAGDAEAIAIVLSDDGSTSEGPGVEIDGSTVTITAAGDYELSGSLSDGQIVIDAPEDAKVRLILNGVSLIKNGHAAIYALSADKLVLSTEAGSENLLQSTGEFVQTDENKVDAAVFAKCDLTLSGEGVLNISSLTGHAVVTKDDLKLKSGTVNLEAAGKGLCGKDSVTIEGGVVNADVGTDGVCSDKADDPEKGGITMTGGALNLLCQKDGLDASGDILIEDGAIVISAGSNQAGKGIESDASVSISGGTLSVTAVDDAIHASGNVTVSGGSLTLSSGDDGIHADAQLLITAGKLYVSQSYEGLEAQVILVEGGDIAINARDDGFNAAGGNDSSESRGFFGGDPFETDSDALLNISGGRIIVNADGDGLDSNGYLNVSGGTVYVSGPTNSANGAIDYGIEGTISGGTVIAVGAAGMAENFGQSSTQGSILLNLGSLQAAGSTVSITDANGALLASFEPAKSYSSVVISAPGLVQGGSYTVRTGSDEQTVTLSELIYGGGMGMGMPGGFGGQKGQGIFGGGYGRDGFDPAQQGFGGRTGQNPLENGHDGFEGGPGGQPPADGQGGPGGFGDSPGEPGQTSFGEVADGQAQP